MERDWTPKVLQISQSFYIEEVLPKYEMDQARKLPIEEM
jgi:hypothetical protein